MDQKQVYSTKMSEGGKDSERSPQNLAETIADNFIAKLRPLLLDFMDQKQFHSTKMKDSQKAPYQNLTETIGTKITKGITKIESLFSSACIYRVPGELRKLNESAYTPRLIAIGPLHRNDPHLQTPTQHVKFSYTNKLFCRLTKGIEDTKLAEEKKFEVLQECVAEMEKSIDDAKKCYAEEVTLKEEMLLVDGCFILELLYRHKHMRPEEGKKPTNGGDKGKSKQQQPLGEEGGSQSSNSREIGDPLDSIWNANIVQQDLLLLENQIPYSVLKKLFQLTVAQIPDCPCNSLTDYVSSFFCDMMSPEGNSKNSDSATITSCCPPSDLVLWIFPNQRENSKEEKGEKEKSEKRGDAQSTNDNYDHILHKLHEELSKKEELRELMPSASDLDNALPHEQPKKEELRELMPSASDLENALPHEQSKKEKLREPMPSASDLDYAGIKFLPAKGNNLFNVEFIEHKGAHWWCHRAHFKIPPLGIYDSTEAFLRNLIAFEQCHPQASQHFTCYAYLMDMLVNSEKDIKVLEKAGVLSNHLGDSENATVLFNKLCKEIVVGDFFFGETCNKVTEYSKRCWPKNMAHLRRTYFASPWTFIAFCVGFIAFGLSIIQFILSFVK